jgi:hypothetical protein
VADVYLVDVRSIEELQRKLARLPRPVENAVRKSNRKWATKLRDLIRAEAAAILGSGSKYGGKHDTKPGAVRRSIKSRASARSSRVTGGGTGAPHFNVSEYGGGVRWHNIHGKSHGIPVKAARPSGYFFMPTVRDHIDEYGDAAAQEAFAIVRAGL